MFRLGRRLCRIGQRSQTEFSKSDETYLGTASTIFQLNGTQHLWPSDSRPNNPVASALIHRSAQESSCTLSISPAPEKHPNDHCRGWLYLTDFNNIVITFLVWADMAAHPSAVESFSPHMPLGPRSQPPQGTSTAVVGRGAPLTFFHPLRCHFPRPRSLLEMLGPAQHL